jgi:hypothetical protein
MDNKKLNKKYSFDWLDKEKARLSTVRTPLSTTPVKPSPSFKRPVAIAPPAPPKPKDVNISISLAVPVSVIEKFRLLIDKIKSFKLPTRQSISASKRFKPILLGMVAIVLIGGAWHFITRPTRPDGIGGVVQGAETENTTPDFEAMVPNDKKDIERKYDPKHKVVTFKDQLAGTEIVVSEQKLPETFKLDPQGSLETFAKKINATTPIEAGDTKGFAGKSVNGPQTIVFQKDGRMVFIYSPKELTKEVLADYIKILQ